MAKSLTAEAPAKLNLSLHVAERREDGYHNLRMVMQSVKLADRVAVTIGTAAPLKVSTNLPFLPRNEKNLAAIAALRFEETTGIDLGGVELDVQKELPVCAGLGGGSSDAAAVLRAVNTLTGAGLSPEQLAAIGAQVGSDVPYCVLGGTALAEGRGELLTPLPPLPHCYVVLCKPDFRISTPELFGALDLRRLKCKPDTEGIVEALGAGDLRGVACRIYNVFEDVLDNRRAGEVAEIKQELLSAGALGACMSGTGPTVFGLFACREAAQAAFERLRERWSVTFFTETV